MRKALAFSKSQKMSMILLIILTCAVLFLGRGQVSGNTYLLAILGWPLVIFLLNLIKPHDVEFVTAAGEASGDDSDGKKGKKANKDKKKKK